MLRLVLEPASSKLYLAHLAHHDRAIRPFREGSKNGLLLQSPTCPASDRQSWL